MNDNQSTHPNSVKGVFTAFAVFSFGKRLEQEDQLAARAYSRWAVWQVLGIERRLGVVAGTVLGDAAADLEVQRDRSDGGHRQLRRIARQAGLHRRPGLGRG